MRKILNYIYDDKEIQITSSGKLKLSDIIKRSISRKGYDLNKFIEDNDSSLEKCRICKTHYPPFIIECHEDNGIIMVNGFSPIKDKVYCYGLNKECPGIKMNSNSVEFISKTLLLTREEALKHIKSNNCSIFYRENWDNEEDYKKSQKRDSEYFKEKYPNSWEIKYNEYIDKIKKSNSLERYIGEYGKEEGTKLFTTISNSKDSMSFTHFLLKNNNNFEKTKFEYEKRRKSVSTNLESFIRRHGSEVGNLEYNKLVDRKSNNQLEYISTLTEDERKSKYSITIEKVGISKYNEWREKVLVPITRASKESAILFNRVIETIDYDIYVGIGENKEYFIKDEFNRIFFYDFVIKSKKIIIEYNGTRWHPKFENLETFKPIHTTLSAIDMYNRQQYKINLAKRKGFKVLEVWSDDIDNYEKCLNFIKNNENNE